jgi:tRNA-uridine 2-sulfurtransferase
MKKVVLGFSGGVDSAVCAKLLKDAGFDVHGLYMDNIDEKALSDAVGTAEFIGIPLEVRDVHRELDSLVCSRFAESYLRGETPNPCIICNPTLKFKTLLGFADEIGAVNIATGHYARAENGVLYKGMPSNDQSYMLCRIRKEQLDRLILPLGKYEKTQVRKLAEGFNLPVAHKPDSMEICFIPDKDYISWLAGRAELPPAGDFVFHGEVVGRHDGIYRYTVGQRRPGLYDGRKLYISAINAEKNEIELALWEELFKTQVTAKSFNWLCDEPNGPVRATVRVRHTKWENPPCTAYIEGDTVKIVCDEPVRAPARGQSAVLYDGDRVLGGGFIM